jgi:HAD superfamily hydrolase (TIGR01509 family)
MIRALFWDVDGTLAETERFGHLSAFNRAFAEAGVPWRWSEARYGELLRVTGGRERLLFDMQSQPAAPGDERARTALAAELHRLKSRHYEAIVETGQLPLRPGVAALLEDCARAAVMLAVVTTTSRANVVALLGRHLGLRWRERFATLVCAEEAARKKPDPLAYRVALANLALDSDAVVAVEDSPAGVEAARRAGVRVVLTRSYYFADTPAGAAVLAAGPSLGDACGWSPALADGATRVSLAEIERWRKFAVSGADAGRLKTS